jgi:deoxyribose-phosphate aldolase
MSKSKNNTEIIESEALWLAGRIQSTIISNVLTCERWEQHVAECVHYHFQAAMIPAAWVRRTAERLRGTGIRVASFVDFPYGTMTSAGKAFETGQLIENGAEEVDLMPNVGYLLSGMDREYAEDIRGVVQAAGKVPVKVMLELPLLSARQQERAVFLSVDAGRRCSNARTGGFPSSSCTTARSYQGLWRDQNCPASARPIASGGGSGWDQCCCPNHSENSRQGMIFAHHTTSF